MMANSINNPRPAASAIKIYIFVLRVVGLNSSKEKKL